MLMLGPLAAAGCSTWVEVRPLATSRVDVEAFELRGPELTMLHSEVLRRCPQGAEVLRQAAHDQRAAADSDGSITRWMNHASAWVDPPQRQAQMMVVCKPSPQGLSLALAKVAVEASPNERTTSADTGNNDKVLLPIGPITPEW